MKLHQHDIERLQWGEHSTPHDVLGAHLKNPHGRGVEVRAFHPDAIKAQCLLADGRAVAMDKVADGIFAVDLPEAQLPLRYRLRFWFEQGRTWEREDPYRFLPTVGDLDLHLFNEGNHYQLWKVLGAHPRTMDGIDGVSFAVWAPNAKRVSVVGDFCGWDGRLFPMRAMGSSGVFELFVPGAREGALYKYEIKTLGGHIRIKSDPMAAFMEEPPATASRVFASRHQWSDAAWMKERASRDIQRSPVAMYEVHLASWARVPEEGYRPLTYREIAPRLVAHVKALGFNYLELMPIAEHPFSGSWGYQVSGYYAPTSRFGNPDDFRYFVDYCHQNGIGVIIDWVPAHFPKDDFALARFDGTPLYEHEDPRRGEHPDWGTLIFNYGRHEVRNFLIANALYWLEEFHIDGLRVDAVASMLYLDYSRKAGEWWPNQYGGRENLEAVDFLRAFNHVTHDRCPGSFTIAEESTAWSGVTRPAPEGGLGFTFKWNMGWMHDTLEYFKKDPIYRQHHQNDITFAMLYEHTERFVMPLSHDEVVHGKGSLLGKMPGDHWQKCANLRALLSYQYTRPGKKLLFMGTEIAPDWEWSHSDSLPWHLEELDPLRRKLKIFVGELGRLYQEEPCLWQSDPDPWSFAWIDCHDAGASVLSFIRRAQDRHVLVVLNLTPVPREHYRIGAPQVGRYIERFSSDDPRFGGSAFETIKTLHTDPVPMHGCYQSLNLRLPPLGVMVFQPQPA